MASTDDPFFAMTAQPAAADPTVLRAPFPLETASEWASRYALWSAIHSMTAFNVALVASELAGGNLMVVWALIFVSALYVVGIPIALIVAMIAAHVLVRLPGLRSNHRILRPTFALAAVVLGAAPLLLSVAGGESPVAFLAEELQVQVLGAGAVIANAVAAWRVWAKVGPAPEHIDR